MLFLGHARIGRGKPANATTNAISKKNLLLTKLSSFPQPRLNEFYFTSCAALAGIFPLTQRNFSSETLNVSLPLFTSIFTGRTVRTHNYSLRNKRGKKSKRSLENAKSTQHFLVCVRSRRAVLGTGRNKRVLGEWGIKKGGERVPLLVEKADAQNSGCLLLGPSPQREGRKGPVPGFSVPGFSAGGIGIEQGTPLGLC